MPSLRDLRTRIRSVKNMQKITKAMELVAAAKMRRAQERVLAARPYSDELSSIAVELAKRSGETTHLYLTPRPVERRCIILVTTDRGLVGALNGNNIRLALQTIRESDAPTSVVAIGRKGRDSMKRLRKDLVAEVTNYGDAPRMGTILPAIRVALQQFERGEVDQVSVVFARFVSAAKQQATLRQVVPVQLPEDAPKVAGDFEYEPDPDVVLNALLPRYVEAQVYQAVLENVASEQAAKMLAMRNASDNANDLIGDLTLTANKVRQSSITSELMDIVGGTAALAGASQ